MSLPSIINHLIAYPLQPDHGFSLRLGQPSDESTLYDACYPDWPRDVFWCSFHHVLYATTRGRGAILVAICQHHVIGSLQLFRLPRSVELANLAGNPAWRRHHVASTMIQAIVPPLIAMQFNRLELRVAPENQPALALYHKLGFVGQPSSGAEGKQQNYISLSRSLVS